MRTNSELLDYRCDRLLQLRWFDLSWDYEVLGSVTPQWEAERNGYLRNCRCHLYAAYRESSQQKSLSQL